MLQGWLAACALLLQLGHAVPTQAQPDAFITRAPAINSTTPKDQDFVGKPVYRLDVVSRGTRWTDTVPIRRVELGEPYTGEVARRAMRELLDTGRFSTASAEVRLADAQGVWLIIYVEPRRIVKQVRLQGSPLATDALQDATQIQDGMAVSEDDLPKLTERVRQVLVYHGYPTANVQLQASDTEDPLATNLVFDIDAGPPALIERRLFVVTPQPAAPELSTVLQEYAAKAGDPVDQEVLDHADHDLERELRRQGWHRAVVSHRMSQQNLLASLAVVVQAGALVSLAFEGHRTFDYDTLIAALDIESNEDLSPGALADKIRSFYVKRGFLDVDVRFRIDGLGTPNERLVFVIREQHRVRVVGREYPCLTGARTPESIGEEIDSYLSEDLPGAEILGPVDPTRVDHMLGPEGGTGTRPQPFDLNPWTTYDQAVYDKATQHVQDLYRAEGYLSATVGTTQVLRRRCDPHAMPGSCEPIGDRQRPRTFCAYDDIGLPIEEPAPDPRLGCVADPAHGVECEPTAILHIPIKLGPRTVLWDVAFDGNARLTEQALWDTAGITLGGPVSYAEIDLARRRMLDAYAEAGFAFADISTALDLSPNRQRARLRISVREGEQVRVSEIYIRGSSMTRESLIRSRVALTVGEPYRLSDVRATEEHLATLGVFSSVHVGFEDPYVPAREKVVVVNVVERVPQYVETRPGISSGEGFRFAVEYGHLNVFHRAIQFAVRTQIGYLPDEFILDSNVKHTYETDPLLKTVTGRLTRQNSLAVTFPDIGLGPLFGLRVEGLDVLRNARDFQLVKDANIDTLTFRPSRKLTFEFGGSLERNVICIFLTDCTHNGSGDDVLAYIEANPQFATAFRAPAGTSVAVTQKFGLNWDARNVPLDATRGYLINATLEHVTAFPVTSGPATLTSTTSTGATTFNNPFRATHSEFLRATNRVAGYLPVGRQGAALALSFRWGLNLQLEKQSSTYPDRLFFAGGVDTIRGFLQDSLVPEDIAQRVLRGEFPVAQYPIRGGDFFLNPRAELRIPLTHTFQTALFLDAGNVWTQAPSWLTLFSQSQNNTTAQGTGNSNANANTLAPLKINYWRWRYAVGTGLRLNTPVGPLAFDYGFNVERVLDQLGVTSPANRRTWEDLGAFHFSIGLF